jgi:hypothetical protein
VRRGTGSAANGGTRSSGCTSSKGSPHRGPRSTRHRTRRRERRKRSGGRPSLIAGSLHPRHRSRLRWQERHRLGRAQGRPSPGNRQQRQRGPRRRQRASQRRPRTWRRRPRARWRGLEVQRRSRRPHPQRQRGPRGRGSAPSPPRGRRSSFEGLRARQQESDHLFASPQGGSNRASPRTGQGAEGGCIRPYPAAFLKGAAGGGERSGDGECEFTGCCWGLEATAGGLACRAAAGGC